MKSGSVERVPRCCSTSQSAGPILPSNPVRCPTCKWRQAPFTAPHLLWPSTTISRDPREFAGAFHAGEDVLIERVARDANAENIAEPLIEDQLSAGPRVDAAQDNRERVLLFGCLVDLLQEIAIEPQVADEARFPSWRS